MFLRRTHPLTEPKLAFVLYLEPNGHTGWKPGTFLAEVASSSELQPLTEEAGNLLIVVRTHC